MILVPPERIRHYVAQGWWGERTLGALFLDTAARLGDAPAVIDAPNRAAVDGEAPCALSWARLRDEVGRWAATLHALGLRKDDVLVVQLPNSTTLHALYLACAATGRDSKPRKQVMPVLAGPYQ